MTRLLAPAAATAAAALVVCGALLLGGAAGLPPAGGDPPGPVLDEADRRAVDAEPLLRGAEAPPPDPGVTFTDPAAVVRAYLQAAYSVTGDDAGRTHLRAAPYSEPGTPVASVGVVVLDPPPPGATRSASVRSVELVAAGRDDRRRGYRAVVETRTTGTAGTAFTTTVAVARQPDGRWLVTSESPDNPDLPAGED